MGAVAGGRCFADAPSAAQAECAAYPRASTYGGVVATWSCQGVAVDGSSLSLLKTDTSGAAVSQSLALSFPDCDPMESYNDSLTLWGAGIAACAAIFCLKAFVYRLVANQ